MEGILGRFLDKGTLARAKLRGSPQPGALEGQRRACMKCFSFAVQLQLCEERGKEGMEGA